MIHYVVYSHSSYADILEIQSDYISGKGHLTLFIDKNDLDLSKLYSKFDKVVFYNNDDVYGKRVFDCLNQIDYEYFIFIHDNDILFHTNDEKILKFLNYLKVHNYDRIDFQLSWPFYNNKRNTISDDGIYLIKQDDINEYIYNVNPSIWKRETLLKITDRFKHKSYRSIEDLETQQFCLQFNIFKLFSNKIYRCCHYTCLDPFRYLHITHDSKIICLYKINPVEAYEYVKPLYNSIVDKYNLKNSNKWID